jgi:glycosyltransferase involved in cell wall biosynthesis
MLKSLYVGFAFNHHGLHAGYNQIKTYLNYNKVIDCQKDYDFLQYFFSSRTIFSRIFFLFFGFRLFWVELKLIFISILNPKKHVFHIIYGENIYKYLGYFKLGNKIVLTLHQPPSFFEDDNQKRFLKELKRVDKLIVMSEEMESYFRDKFPKIDVLFIPHGVDTSFFKPKGVKKDQILLIGNWLRDFEFASKVFARFEFLRPDVLIKIVTSIDNHKYFINNRVECLSAIEDEKLLELYQQSKIVFLPLKEFTANNALLEAISCGNKVIVATKSQNIENCNSSAVQFVIDDVEEVCGCLSTVIQNWNFDDVFNSRSFIVENYCWEIIANKTELFLYE